jgi:hypothetical protein
MQWFAICLPRGVRTPPVKLGQRKYSVDQAMICLLAWFAAQPLDKRLDVVNAWLMTQKAKADTSEVGSESPPGSPAMLET